MKKIKLLIIIFLVTKIVTVTVAQAPPFQWVSHFGSTAGKSCGGNAITHDAFGNVYSVGYFSGEVDFDPDSTNTLYMSDISTVNGYNGYVIKQNAAGQLIWVKAFLGTGFVYGNAIAVDDSDNVYVTGLYSGTADFDPSSTTYNLTAHTGPGDLGIEYDIFISKLDASGNLVWAKTLGGEGGDSGNSIAIDTIGNVYISGSYSSDYYGTAIDLNPGAGVDSISNSGSFVLKLTGSGNFVWAKAFTHRPTPTTGDYCSISKMALDKHNNNIYVTGAFGNSSVAGGITDFNTGLGASDTLNIIAQSIENGFIARLNADGSSTWVKVIAGGSGSSIYANVIPYDIGLDAAANVYTVGSFRDTIDFDPGAGESILSDPGFTSAYILKLDLNGNYAWVKQLQGYLPGYAYVTGRVIAVDDAGNNYIGGDFQGLMDFNPGAGIDTSNVEGSNYAYSNFFIDELDANGNYVWGENSVARGYNMGEFTMGIAVDNEHNVYTTGHFTNDTIDFNFGSDTAYLHPLAGVGTGSWGDAYVLKMGVCTSSLSTPIISQSGDSLIASDAATYQWYKDGIAISGANTQSYHATGNGIYTVCSTAHGETCRVCSDPFSLATGILEHSLDNVIAIYPNPNNGQFEIALQLNTQDNYTLELTDALGQVLYHEELKNYIGTYHKQLDETKYGAGIYLFRVKNSKDQSVKKVISF